MRKSSQKGIAHLGLLLILVVAAVVAFAGYKVYHARKNSPVSTPVASTTSGAAVQAINTKADLTTVENQLNSQNIGGDLNPTGFDADVSSMQ